MNTQPAWQHADELWSHMRGLLANLRDAPRAPHAPGAVPSVPGIYLFSDRGRYRYVGQTRNLRERLGQHTRPSGTHYSATLAFLLAVERAKEKGLKVDGRLRAVIQHDPEFVPYFARAKADVASWDVQFIRVEDPLIRTVFEVYVHIELATDLNSFETH